MDWKRDKGKTKRQYRRQLKGFKGPHRKKVNLSNRLKVFHSNFWMCYFFLKKVKWTFGFHIINSNSYVNYVTQRNYIYTFDLLYSTQCWIGIKMTICEFAKTVVPLEIQYDMFFFVRFLVLSDLIQTSWLCIVTSIEYMFIIKCQMIFL